VVGGGHHRKAGGPHAEVFAIRAAGSEAEGATLAVTLEPCSTRGRTPACTDAILEAGIREVIIGCTDPNPAHAGAALDILRGAGVNVVSGVLPEACRHLIRAFTRVQETGLPYVSLKMACTLDGRIADADGKSKWITGPESRERVQQLRRECDAILVGTGTVMEDNPTLLPRPQKGRTPLRIIPDRQGRLPLSRTVFSDGEPTLCLLGPEVSASRKRALERRGVEWMEVPVSGDRIAWRETGFLLVKRGVQHILCEGGGQLTSALLKAELVQELHWVTAPTLLGMDGRPAVAEGWSLKEAPQFHIESAEQCGKDLWVTLRA
jgi:diaminohydroxyphosphoribosylaminopyrimidine deaminase/5-amino-6-(5-phosphoribosylamino)uracil reductase